MTNTVVWARLYGGDLMLLGMILSWVTPYRWYQDVVLFVGIIVIDSIVNFMRGTRSA